jgi:hypothetical protein
MVERRSLDGTVMKIAFHGSRGRRNLQNGSQMYVLGFACGIISINFGTIKPHNTHP